MESSEQTPQSSQGENQPGSTVTFEVVRRTEYVFEPFMGSLLQLPAVRMQRAQSSEFFLAQAPPAEAAEVGVEQPLVWERPSAIDQIAPPTRNVAPAASPIASSNPFVQAKKEKKIPAKEQDGPRFYQPPTVRFFDPVAAAAEEGEGAEALEWLGPRPSTELSAELKAAILRIDEQRRQMQHEVTQEKPVKEKKRGFLKAKPARVEEVPIEIVNPRPVDLTEREARWEDISPPQPTADVPVEVEAEALQAVNEPNTRPPAEVEQIAALSAVPSSASEQEAVSQMDPAPETSASHEAARSPEIIWLSGTASPPEIEEQPPSRAPIVAEAIPSDLTAARATEPPLLPMVLAADSSTPTNAEEKRKGTAPSESSSRLGAITSAISRLRRADLVKPPVASSVSPTPLVKLQAQIAPEPELANEKEKPSLAMRLQRWVVGESRKLDGNRRRAERRIMPGLVAFYWSGGNPKPHEIVNISKTGFYVKTTEFWSVETLVRMTLQRPATETKRKGESISVLARVVRIDEGGVGHEFVTTEALTNARSLDIMPSQGTDWRELDRFLHIQ